jgi:transposase
MKDTDLYSQILGVKDPWFVSKVDLAVAGGNGSIKIAVEVKENHRLPCPECGAESPGYDTQKRTWRHLDTCQLQTLIESNVPRVNCKDHGVKLVKVPWAEKNSQFTLLFERFAIDVLQQCHITGARKLLGLTWDEAWGIKARAVKRGLGRRQLAELPKIGLDEKAIAKRHRYAALVYDLENPRVLHVAEDRRETSLDGFWATLNDVQKDSIQAVAMDMWDPYIASTRAHVPNGERKIVFDRFHIMKHMNEAVDAVRKEENRLLLEDDIDILKGTKFFWLFAEENLPEKMVERFAFLRDSNLKTGRAWAIKESLRELWNYRRRGWAELYWRRWYFWATHCRLKPVRKVAAMIHNHLENVLTYFDHRITNAVSEGLNSKIQTVKKTPTDIAIGSI